MHMKRFIDAILTVIVYSGELVLPYIYTCIIKRNEMSKLQIFHPEHLCNSMRENCNAAGFIEAVYACMVEGPSFQVESLYPGRAGV